VGPKPEPVAVAADSPLTVAGAAPVSHRTSLSHREGDAITPYDKPPSRFPLFAGEIQGKNPVPGRVAARFTPASYCDSSTLLLDTASREQRNKSAKQRNKIP